MPVGINFFKLMAILALLLSVGSGAVRLLNKKASWSEGVTSCLSVLGLIWVAWT